MSNNRDPDRTRASILEAATREFARYYLEHPEFMTLLNRRCAGAPGTLPG